MDNRSITVDLKKAVPGLHPGLNDLIRVLGKQAHCASRTLIVCEPVCPKATYSESKYHKNCGSPKKGRSWDSLCRPSSLWSPVRPETYYYDCFFYRQYPDRDSEYQEIEDKYNAIKQQKLDYSPPECDDDKIRAVVSGGSLNRSGGARYTGFEDSSKNSVGKGTRGGKRGGGLDDWSGPGAFRNKDNVGESSMGSHRNQKYPLGSGSKRNMVSEMDSVPCAELAEIRDLLKKSDRETIRRMQEMLTLMKELSVRDICRATCDGSPPGERYKTGGTRSTKSEEDFYVSQESRARMEQGTDSRKWKEGDVSDHGLQDQKKRYQQRGDSMRQNGESDGYGPQGTKKSYQQRSGDYEIDGPINSYKQRDDDYARQGPKKRYQQRDDDYDYGPQGQNKNYQRRDDEDYGPEGSIKRYQPFDDGQGPRESNKSYKLGSESSRKMKGEYEGDDENGNYYDVERQDSETFNKQGKSSKKFKRGADDEGHASIRSSQRRDPVRKGKKKIADDGLLPEDDEENVEDYAEPQLDLENDEHRSLQRHLVSPNMSGGRLDGEDESQSSTSDSERSSSSMKGGKPSPRRGKQKKKNTVSDSDTDLTESSSIYSESSTTDIESSDMELKEPGMTSSSRSMQKRQEDGSIYSSQASLSEQGSASNLSKTRSEDRSRPGLYQEQRRVPGSTSAGAPGQPGPGANYKIPVGKKNVPLTVHEVVELSNKITDIIVLEIIDELIRNGLYFPPSRRHLDEPGATMPRTSVESEIRSKSSRQRLNEQKAFNDTRDSSGYKGFSKEERMNSTLSPTRLSRIDESSSRTGLSKGPSRKEISTQDMKGGEKRRSGESRRSSCPRHSKSLSPSTSSRRRSSTCRLEIERRARSEGDRYDGATQPRMDIGSPKPWERRLSSQLKAESMRDSSRVTDAEGGTGTPGSRRALSSQVSGTGSYRPPSSRPDQVPLRDSSMHGSLSGRQPTLPGVRRKITESSPKSSTQYEVAPQDRPDMPGSRGASSGSQMSKAGSHRAPSTPLDQASLKDGSLPGRQPTSRESSPRSTKQYEAPPQDRSDMPGNRRASMSSRMSKTGSYRAPSTQPDQSSLKDGSLPGRSMPGTVRDSMNSQKSKQSGGSRPSYGPGKTDSRQRDIYKNSSLSGTRIEAPGKVPSGPRTPKEGSRTQGILKDSSVPESLQIRTQIDDQIGSGQVPLSQIPKESTGEVVYVSGRDPNGSQIPMTIQQPDKTSSKPRIIDQDIINQPTMMGEVSKGRLVTISRNENIDIPDAERTDVRAIRGTAQQSRAREPCPPDDFIATNYDTDNSVLYYARITSNAFPPLKETYHAAGFMLRSAYDYSIPPRSKMSIKTDLLLQLPRNSYGRIAPRKCLIENYGIDVGADVIDRDYKGNITVVLFNHGDRTFTVERGNKVAQLICESIHLAKVVENSNLLK